MKNLNALPHIDWKECIQNSNNKPNFAEQMLSIFIDELQNSVDAISKADKKQDTYQLQLQIHKLHGACCYSGVPRLRLLANELETMIKTEPDNEQIHQHTQMLLSEADQIAKVYADGNYK